MCGSFESHFNRCDESEMNAARLSARARAHVNLGKPGKCAVFCDSDALAVTVPCKGALTINRGRKEKRCRGGERRVGKPTGPAFGRPNDGLRVPTSDLSERVVGSTAWARRYAPLPTLRPQSAQARDVSSAASIADQRNGRSKKWPIKGKAD
jgi:hypothetical protein